MILKGVLPAGFEDHSVFLPVLKVFRSIPFFKGLPGFGSDAF
jgi:hypothetical protein